MSRFALLLVPALSSLALGCGPESSPDPGQATGACVENACEGTLVCVQDGCVDPNSTVGGTGPGTGGSEEGPSEGPDSSVDDADTGDVPGLANSVSILVVMDNSGSMGEEQARAAPALGALAEGLTDAGVDWRMGFTTTDNGNPWCSGTTPEGGGMRLSSCRSRQSEFVFDGATSIDFTDAACLDFCEQDSISILPTTVEDGGEASVRPWFQSIGGESNLDGGSLAASIACAAPQGINGCGFEQQLESMQKAVLRADTDGDANFGFVPPDALLVVVIITDEADCSYNGDHESIFLPEGERIFWSNPDSPTPTSAVCWNAGVSCKGSDCASVNLDVFGVDTTPDDAVLRPVSRYIDGIGASNAAMVMLVAGVADDGTVTYEDSLDPLHQEGFGIGPGCDSAEAGPATPPVRQRELAQAHPLDGGRSLFSVCSPEYSQPMNAVLSAVLGRLG